MPVNKTRTILLVEDDSIIALAQKAVLEKYGYRVIVANSGEQALSLAGNTDIDLILMDINLGPGMDGTETAEQILASREVPLIFLSSHTEPAVVEKTEGITSYGYVVKNSGETVLNAAIKMAFRLFEAKMNELATERALQENEAGFHKLFQDVPAISVQGYTADGTIRYWNRASEALYGYTAEEAAGRNIVELIIPEELRTTVQRDIRRMAETGHPIPASEMSLIRKDGATVPVFSTHTVVKKYRGAVEVFSLDIDLSETVRNERTAYAREERWELALKGAGHGVWDFDLLNNEIYVSRNVMSMLGLDGQNYRNAHDEWVARLHPEDRETVLAATEQHFFGRTEMRTIEYRLRCEDGTYRWVRDQGRIVSRTDDGRPERAIGTVTDITDRKKVEFKLIESESRLAAFTRALPDIGFIYGPRGRVIEVLTQNEELLYKPAEQMRGKRIGEYLPSSQAEQIMSAIRRTFETGVPQTVEYDLDVIGGHRWFEGRIALMENRIGESRRAVMIARDITKRKHTEEHVLQLVQQKEILLKETHHRIKNNMSVIKSLLSLQATTDPNGACADALQDAANRVQTMMALYDRLYRSEHYHETNLGELLRTLVPEIIESFSTGRNRNIHTVVEVEEIVLNARLLAPIGIMLNEMITNAVKHAFRGIESATICITGSRDGDTVTLQCADNGIGLPAELPDDSGATFGLELIRILTEQIKGRLQIERSGGTRYTVRFKV